MQSAEDLMSNGTNGLNGHAIHTDDEEEEGEGDFKTRMKRINSIGLMNSDDIARKHKQDEDVANYVSNQLQRMRTDEDWGMKGMHDEIEAQLDGTSSNGDPV